MTQNENTQVDQFVIQQLHDSLAYLELRLLHETNADVRDELKVEVSQVQYQIGRAQLLNG